MADERESLFRRLSDAAKGLSGGAEEPRPGTPPAPPEPDAAARFAELFTAAGGIVFRGVVEESLPALAETLRSEGVTALFFPEDDGPARRVAEGLIPFGPFAVTTGAEVRGGDPAATAGFRTADAAIAETGTVVETSAGGKTLLPGLLADVHVSIVPASAVAASMEEALSVFTADPPRNISFLSGPSKTADIEQTLTTGAHGPKKAIALLLARDTISLTARLEPRVSR
ncbi:MAG: lactate utilization protein [Deltaproteobacteria bacterium]